jgi:ribosomal protein S18 acetylase RimI-like enzyme
MIKHPARVEADYAFLFEVYAQTRSDDFSPLGWSAEECERFVRVQFELQEHNYRQRYPDAEHSLILVDDTPAGQLRVARRRAEHVLVDLALLPCFRNRHIGGGLIEELMSEARAAHVPLLLSVRSDNPARRLYARLGFRELHRDTASIRMMFEQIRV